VIVKGWRLSDSDWHAILEAVGPLLKGVNPKKARREVERALNAYRGFPTRERLAAARVRWRRYEKLAIDLHEGFRWEWRKKHARYNPFWDDALYDIRSHAKSIIADALGVPLAARKGRSDPPRQWLYGRLFEIWTNDLRGNPSASMTATGGPMVRFIRAVCALVNVTPRVSAVRAIIKKERRVRTKGVFQAAKNKI
jgi:hypothetical protein